MITFTVDGKPATKGSFRAFTVRRANGKIGARVDNDNPRCKPWQDVVGWAARQAMRSAPPMTGPVTLDIVFRFERPKTTKLAVPAPDIDKLARAVLDALTGIVYVDDKQVVDVRATKSWGAPGVRIEVEQESRP